MVAVRDAGLAAELDPMTEDRLEAADDGADDEVGERTVAGPLVEAVARCTVAIGFAAADDSLGAWPAVGLRAATPGLGDSGMFDCRRPEAVAVVFLSSESDVVAADTD